MAEFSGKIIDAMYVNAEYTMVKIVYEHEGQLCVYHIEADPNNPTWQEFLDEGWDQERLIESTSEYKRAQSEAFNIEVNNAAKAMMEELVEREVKALEKIEDYFDFIATVDDKDSLFKFKLWALETPALKDATKQQKSKIRKAKSVLEGFAILHEIKNTAE